MPVIIDFTVEETVPEYDALKQWCIDRHKDFTEHDGILAFQLTSKEDAESARDLVTQFNLAKEGRVC